jgi:hypothetical protein
MKESAVGVPWKEIGGSGVRVSAVMVTGRQKVEGSELKRVKASCSSAETGGVNFNCYVGVFWIAYL